MKRYSCGCRVAAVGENIPGVSFTLRDPDAVNRAGWFEQSNTRDGDHLVSPCRKHMPGVIARWGTRRIFGAHA
jgi:hypothetical protein